MGVPAQGRIQMSHLARLIQAVSLAGLLIAAAACGGSASPSPSTAAGAPSAQASTTASAEPSAPPASELIPSIDIPSFTLPSSDKELEGLLPDQLCGKTAKKTSASGFTAVQNDPQSQAILRTLGRSMDDVSVAIAFADPATGGDCKVAAGIYRIKGTNPDQLLQAFRTMAQEENEAFTQKSVGGKNVYVSAAPQTGITTYAYFGGDAFLFVSAPDEATAAPVLQEMP